MVLNLWVGRKHALQKPCCLLEGSRVSLALLNRFAVVCLLLTSYGDHWRSMEVQKLSQGLLLPS